MSWWCGTESKAFLISKKIAATCLFFTSSWCQELLTERRASCVEKCGMVFLLTKRESENQDLGRAVQNECKD